MSGTKVSIKYGFGKPQAGSLKKAELAIDLLELSLWTAESDFGPVVRVGHDTTEVEQGVEDNATQIEINRQDIVDIIVDVEANRVEIDKNAADIIINKDNIATLDADAVKKSVATLQQIVGAIKAASFEGDGSKLSGITTDQLADVNSAGANKDEFLIYNGSSWIAEGFHIDTELTYQGGIDMTQPAPASPLNGDLYINNKEGIVHSSWTGIAGQTVREGNVVGYAATKSRWFLLGDIASSSVTDVEGGSGIDVDDSKPAEPVVSIDRAEVDTWYEPKFSKLSGFNKNFGTTAGTVSQGNHSHNEFGTFEPAFAKNSAFNKNFGTANNDVARGDHGHTNYITDAPNNSNQYARQGGNWTVVKATGGTDTLQDVTNRGATTTTNITAKNLRTSGDSYTLGGPKARILRTSDYKFLSAADQTIMTVRDTGETESTKFKAQAFNANAGNEEHLFYAYNPNTVAVNGSTGRSVKIEFTTGKYERLYFQDWACVLKIAGSFSGPEMHAGVHACIGWNSQDLKANPKGNVKSLTKLGTGSVRGTYNVDVNVFVAAPCVPTSATNSGNSNAFGFCSSNGDSGSAKTFSAMRKSATSAAIEGSGNLTCGMSINEAARQTFSTKTDMEFEEMKAREIDRLMTRAATTEWYDADEEGNANSPLTWAIPNVKTGGVFITRSLVADQDSKEFYPDHTLIKFAEWPEEDCLFDAWELDGKRLVVNLDKARQQVIETLKHQARFYMPRASFLKGMFDDHDELQELKDLILGLKSQAESKSVSTIELNEVMRKIRQDEDERYVFHKF